MRSKLSFQKNAFRQTYIKLLHDQRPLWIGLIQKYGVIIPKILLVGLLLGGFLILYFYNSPASALYLTYPNYQIKEVAAIPMMDTYIAEGQPDRDFINDQFLRIGFDTNGSTGHRGLQRSILTWNLSALPRQSTINSATFSLWLTGGEKSTALAVQIQRSTAPLPSPLTWNSYNASLPVLANPVVINVSVDLIEYRWDLKTLLQNWSNNQPDDNILTLVMSGGENVSWDHERFFASSDCTDAECGGRKPRLLIRFEEPTPTPTLTGTATLTPTNTSSPTPTATPTPGIKTIRLLNAPVSALTGGDFVTYTIELANGPFDLSNVQVSNPLPEEMELVNNSMSLPPAWTPVVTERTIGWARSTLPAEATVRLVYRAQRHTPTPTPTNTMAVTAPTTPATTLTETPATPTPTSTLTLPPMTMTPSVTPTITPTASPTVARLTITKTGPDAVASGTAIRYVLTVNNSFTRTLTGLTILDVIPVGAEVVDFGGGAISMPPSVMMQWQVPLLNAQRAVTRTFAIRLTANRSQVINDLYFVDVIENGVLHLRAVGKDPVVTTIIGGVLEPLSVLLSLPTLSLTSTVPITNYGAMVTWEYPGFDGQLVSGSVRNPWYRTYLPFIPR